MGLFSRRRERDAALEMLSRRDADWLRAAATRAFAAAGVPGLHATGDHLAGPGDQIYGLGNLAAMLQGVPRRQWRSVVAEHARRMVEADNTPEPQTLDEITSIVYPKLVGDDMALLPGGDATADIGPELADGLHVRASLDYPTHVATLTDLDRFGGWEAVRPYAEENLRRLPAPEYQRLDAGDGAEVHLFASDDLFGASRLLVLDTLLAAAAGLERPTHGSLVAVPNRHLLAVHVLTGAQFVAGTRLLVDIATGEVDGPGPVSEHVYYRSPDGALQRVTRRDEDGTTGVVVDGAFAEALRGLGLIG